ncbi:MAG: hypothetical protein GXX96_24800 [Planctomycetaceae bacterium]|nr:hypothetical protein [Planctomycetaceae bacterium]
MNRIWWQGDYETIQDEVGTVELPAWTRVELRGADRIRLLDALGTNRVNGLAPGQGCETFFTDVKGHIVAHGLLLIAEDSTTFLTAAPRGDSIVAHFNRYIVREDVEVADRSIQTAVWYLGGRQADVFLEDAGIPVPALPCEHVASTLDGAPLTVCRVEMAGPVGFLLIASRAYARAVAQSLGKRGARACTREAFESARIEWGWPLDRIDISADNFPQEVGRDDEAISFTKGCYLGQETVARISSRGHVNKRLTVVRFPTAVTADATLYADKEPIGKTTSAGYSVKSRCPIALAYVRREWAEPGTVVESTIGPAEVTSAQNSLPR